MWLMQSDKMLSMSDSQKRFTVQLDADAFTAFQAMAMTEGVPVAVLARETIYDRIRSAESIASAEKWRAALLLSGRDPDAPLQLPEPSRGSAHLAGDQVQGARSR